MLYIYGGIGALVLIVLIAVGVYSSGGSSSGTAVATANTESASADEGFNAPNATPFASQSEAYAAIREAKTLIGKATESSGDARNTAYKKALYLCDRVLETKAAESKWGEVGRLRYTAMKHQTSNAH